MKSRFAAGLIFETVSAAVVLVGVWGWTGIWALGMLVAALVWVGAYFLIDWGYRAGNRRGKRIEERKAQARRMAQRSR